MSTFLYCLKQGVINICRNIWFSLASVATISACIFLFCLFFAMVANVQHGARAAEETVGISVFFDEGMDEEQIRSIGSQIQSWSEVREARYISAEEAWESSADILREWKSWQKVLRQIILWQIPPLMRSI